MACQGKQILADDRHFMKRKELEGMRPEDLNKLLRSESESVEWKRSLGEWKAIVVASAALASLHGGQICIGVEPTGKVCGVEDGKGTLEDLANKIAQRRCPTRSNGKSLLRHCRMRFWKYGFRGTMPHVRRKCSAIALQRNPG